jgi:hypothetical protein
MQTKSRLSATNKKSRQEFVDGRSIMSTYREHRKVIAVLVLIWVALCGGALSATGKIDSDLHQAGHWLLGQTVSKAGLQSLQLEIVAQGNQLRFGQCTQGTAQLTAPGNADRSGRSLIPELTHYM